jgi:iron complex transport system substrate-binding protein
MPALRLREQRPSPPPARLEVTDEVGRRVSIPQPVRRIVSLAPNLTEIVYALGAEERLVGVTDYCDYPPAARQKPKVGGAVNPSLEQIVALKPDLVLAQAFTLNRRETVDALERLGIAVYSANSASVAGVLESTQHVAEAIGAQEKGETLIAGLRKRLDDLQQRLEGRTPRRVVFVVWIDPFVTIGKQTFIADALRRAGAESVVDVPQEWPRLSLEEVVRLQPEYLVLADAHSEAPSDTAVKQLESRPAWRTLDAVRNRRIAVISEAINRPSPRLVDAIEELARQLHPAAFEEKPETRNSKLEIRPAQTICDVSLSPIHGRRVSNFEIRISSSELRGSRD